MKARSARKKQNTVVQTMTEEERLEERIAQEIQDKLISEEVYKSARLRRMRNDVRKKMVRK